MVVYLPLFRMTIISIRYEILTTHMFANVLVQHYVDGGITVVLCMYHKSGNFHRKNIFVVDGSYEN